MLGVWIGFGMGSGLEGCESHVDGISGVYGVFEPHHTTPRNSKPFVVGHLVVDRCLQYDTPGNDIFWRYSHLCSCPVISILCTHRCFPKFYRLVHVISPKFAPPQITLAISSQTVNIWYYTEPQLQVEEGDMAILFINGLGLSLRAKLVSRNFRPSIFTIIFGLFSSGGETKIAPQFARTG